jgi:hypothetical protein
VSGHIDDATLRQMEQSLATSGLYVAPDLASVLSADQVAGFASARADVPVAVYAVVTDLAYDDPTFHGNAEALLATIRDDTGLDGLFLVVEPDGDGAYRMTSVAYPSRDGDYAIGSVAGSEHPRDVGAMLLDAVDLLRSGDASERLDRIWASEQSESTASGPGTGTGTGTRGTTGADPSGGWSGGATLGVVAGVAVLGALLVTGVRLARRQQVARDATTAHRPFTLPRAVLTTIRAAEDERNARQAEADVLSLGEAIDEAAIGRRLSPAAARAWQAALDHYDVARRILDREHTPADVVGAIVLARRGRSALVAARNGKGWAPPATCYFNPLHTAAATQVRWTDGEAAVTVSACSSCAAQVSAGRTPEDVLDFMAHGRPVHYFKLDLGVWSEAAYGALDPDLIGRLFRA